MTTHNYEEHCLPGCEVMRSGRIISLSLKREAVFFSVILVNFWYLTWRQAPQHSILFFRVFLLLVRDQYLYTLLRFSEKCFASLILSNRSETGMENQTATIFSVKESFVS